jgi:hypothetical protein
MAAQKLEMTSLDARKLLEELTKVNALFTSYPKEMLEADKQQKLAKAIERVIYDLEPRHLARAIAAKGFIPYFNLEYELMYAQTFGFEKQGLKLDNIKERSISEALVSNVYAAMDHIYWAVGALTGEALFLINNKEISSQTHYDLDNILTKLDVFSSKILTVEEAVLSDTPVMEQIGRYIGKTFDFSYPVTDRSWRNNPHWEDFNNHFTEQKKRVDTAIESINALKIDISKYASLNTLIQRLDRYAG